MLLQLLHSSFLFGIQKLTCVNDALLLLPYRRNCGHYTNAT